MTLFEPVSLGRLTLRNGIAVAAMSRMQANADGTVSRGMAEYYGRYAREGVGLIFTEAAFIDEISSRAYFNQPGLATDAQRDTWRDVVEAVHAAGGMIFAQLQHGGRLAEPGLNPLHLAASDGQASGMTWQTGRPNIAARAATQTEIRSIVESFARAARRAVEVGFDGVEVHGARGYLIDDFLSASTNRRDDEFGGSLDRRLKVAAQILEAIRGEIGEVPLSFNFSLYKMDDPRYAPPGGREEVISIAEAMKQSGADILHVTTRKAVRPELWGEPLVQTICRSLPDMPVIANGGMTSLQDCVDAMRLSGASMVSIARSLLANPDWIARVQRGLPLAPYEPGLERRPLEHGARKTEV